MSRPQRLQVGKEKKNCKLGVSLVHRKRTCHVGKKVQRRRMVIVMVVMMINIMRKRRKEKMMVMMEK